MSTKGKGPSQAKGELEVLYFAKVFDRLSLAYIPGAELELELPSGSPDPPKADTPCPLQSQIASIRLKQAIDRRMAAEQRAGESVEQLEHRYREMRWRQRPDITEAFTPAQAEPNESRLHIRNAERDQAEAARRPKPTVHEVDWELMRKECELRLRLSEQRGRNRAKRRQEEMIRHIRANESRDKAT